MIDIAPLGQEWWQVFSERMQTLGVPNVHCISANILDLANAPEPPSFDVVYCSGVLYHMSNPIQCLQALHKITHEYLILTSAVTATTVESEEGTLEINRAASIFVPALQGRERAIIAAHWRKSVGGEVRGLTYEEQSWQPDDFRPWWWLPTADSLQAMCNTAGFICQEGALLPWTTHSIHCFCPSERSEDCSVRKHLSCVLGIKVLEHSRLK